MTTYTYETIPQKKGERPKQFEIQQRITEDALTHHPETGQPIRRVITGGFGYFKPKDGPDSGGGFDDDHHHDHDHHH